MPDPTRPRRRGYGLIELAACAILFAVAATIAAQALGLLASERRAAGRRLRAQQELANLMERVSARPWEGLSAESIRSLSLSPATAAVLRDGRLEVAVEPVAADPLAKKVALLIRWGEGPSTARLVAYFHRRGGAR